MKIVFYLRYQSLRHQTELFTLLAEHWPDGLLLYQEHDGAIRPVLYVSDNYERTRDDFDFLMSLGLSGRCLLSEWKELGKVV
jgi:hypothetical protein